MRRWSPAVSLCAAVLLVVAPRALAQGTNPPEEITIDECAATRSPVSFPHKKHYEKNECVTCHHTQEDLTLEAVQGGMEVEICADCHLKPEEADTPVCTEKSLKKNPFHLVCVDCHKKALAEDESVKAPTKCAECHPKGEGEEESEG